MTQVSVWISALLFTILLMGCQNHTNKKPEKTSIVPSSYTIESLSSQYGIPKEKQTYLITEEADEFRTLVLETFPDSIRRLRSVLVWEYTWQTTPADSMITAWYLPAGDSLEYICHYRHSIQNLY